MKLKTTRLISFISLLVMMVSLFSVCVFPAAADASDQIAQEYANLINNALVVDPDWADKQEGDPITFVYQGQTISESFSGDQHFSSFNDAWNYAKDKGMAEPTILLTAGTYTENIYLEGAVTILGANAGVDPSVKSDNKEVAWSLNAKRSLTDDSKETILKGNIIVEKTVSTGSITIDGVAFVDGGAFKDTARDVYESETTIKNAIFKNAGNEDTAYNALYLNTPNHKRTLNLENLYITGQDTVGTYKNPINGFISPYFVKLNVKNVAYVENKVGFIASSWFAKGDAPYVEIADSCFYNADASTPVGHIISIDNANESFDFTYAPVDDGTLGTAARPYFKNKQISKSNTVSDRPSSNLKLTNNVFYNASAKSNTYDLTVQGGVLHFQFVNQNSAYEIRNNYFYAEDGMSFVDNEFVLEADKVDQSSCMIIRDNVFCGAYKIPALTGSHSDTYIDMSANYFGRKNGEVVNFPVFTTEKNQRLIRTEFYVDKDLKVKNTDWNIKTEDWSLSWVDNVEYNVDVYMYTEGNATAALPIKFASLRDGLKVELFKSAKLDADGIPTSVSNPIDKIDQSVLNQDLYVPTVLYAKVTDPANTAFTPIYTITILNCGDLNNMESFSTAFPGYLLCHPTAAKLEKGDMMPYRWHGKIYKLEVGKNLFETAADALKYGYKNGQESPTVCIPAGVYEEELVLTGSCTILGEKYGINPNVKPYDYLTQDKFLSSPWTLNPERAKIHEETVFYKPIRVADGADDYIITVDGVMMGEGSSYVDDCARNADNVTILKNIFALEAVGGNDRNGVTNTYLFNFNKAFGPVTDRCALYMYDCRVDGLDTEWLFGPFYEKLVVDGLYYANGRNASYTLNNMQSRDVEYPYYSFTNCYMYNNDENQAGNYTWTTHDDQGSVASKKKIIYNLDGNVFHDAFQKGYALMQYYWPGDNMQVYMTNNTIFNDLKDSFIAQTTGGIRYKGNCPNVDCSEILNLKGNRFIVSNRVPLTNGTGNGTNFDWSGNYWSDSVTAAGNTPENLYMIKPNEGTGSYTYEECTRFTIDYTYLDWNMTVRSNEVGSAAASLDFSNGPFGTGKNSVVAGQKVYTDTVAASMTTYPDPALIGEFDTVKYYSNSYYNSPVSALNLTKKETTFYGVVMPQGVTDPNGSGVIKFQVKITKETGTEANVISYAEGIVDNTNKEIFTEVSGSSFRPNRDALPEIAVSDGATATFYLDQGCTEETKTSTNLRFSGSTTEHVLYLKVVSEDGNKSNVYKFIVQKSSVGTKGAVTMIEGMTRFDDVTYQMDVVEGVESVSFLPKAYNNSTIVVTNGADRLIPDSTGVYTFNIGDAESGELKLVASAQSGDHKTTYTLKFKRVINTSVEIFGIEGANPCAFGFAMSLKFGRVLEKVKVDVTAGATYAVYDDYSCTKPIDGPIIVEGDCRIVYVKATSADGSASKIVRFSIYTSDSTRNRIVVKGKVNNVDYTAVSSGDTDYNMYLPANAKKIKLSGGFVMPAYDDKGNILYDEEWQPVEGKPTEGGAVTFYADPQLTVALSANEIALDQKITKVYYKMEEAVYKLGIYDNPDPATKPHTVDVKLSERVGCITIVSDRNAVTYKDANKIADWAKPYVDYLNIDKFGIFAGDQNNNFNGTANITRNEIAVVATKVMGLDVKQFSGVSLEFADKVDTWAAPYVKAAVASGIISGALDGKTGKVTFNGNAYATREQVIKILVSVCMLNDGISKDGATYYTEYKNNIDMKYNKFTFADESKVSAWAKPYMHIAVGEYELVSGSLANGKYYLNPQKNITRAEVAKMVACYMGY